MTRFQFVADHQDAFEVKRLCELVEIERSSFYAWKSAARGREARAAADAELAEKIRTIHADDNTVGAPRVTAELNDGVPVQERVNHKRVARVMRENGIAGYQKKRRVKTTVPEPSQQVVPDLLTRDTNAGASSATLTNLPDRWPDSVAENARQDPRANYVVCPVHGVVHTRVPEYPSGQLLASLIDSLVPLVPWAAWIE